MPAARSTATKTAPATASDTTAITEAAPSEAIAEAAPTHTLSVKPNHSTQFLGSNVAFFPEGKPTFPNLAGVVTQDLVESIGTGKYAAAYVNWSRTQNLLHEHAPGWAVEAEVAPDGTILHKAPVGGYLSLRYVHTDGRKTPYVPQAVMDNRNAAIPYERITARDITDTHRRGSCLAAALFFGLAYELWAKIDVPQSDDEGGTDVPRTGSAAATAPAATKEEFLAAAIEKGLTTFAAEALVKKLDGKYAGGIATLKTKDDAWVASFNEQSAPKDDASQY